MGTSRVGTCTDASDVASLRTQLQQQAAESEALSAANMQLRLELSELRDTQALILQDVVTLTSGMNALLAGHSVYGQRLRNIEDKVQIRYELGPDVHV